MSDSQQPAAVPGATGAAPVASLKRRFFALLLDWTLCLLLAGWFGRRGGPALPSLLLIAEYAFFLGVFGQTPGMWLAKIRCVSVRTGGPIGIPRAALRGLLLALVVPGLIMDADRRGLHDKAAGSVMVSALPDDSRRSAP